MTSDPTLPGLADDKAKAEEPHYLGHRERLRERFLTNPGGLADYEILELMLAAVIPRRDTKPLAKALLQRFGSLYDLFSASPEALRDVDGVGHTTAVFLKVLREAGVRMARRQVMERPVISSWDQLLDYCHLAMDSLPTEQFRLLFLDRKNSLIADELQQKGTVDHTPLYPREVVKRALELHASAIIMVHNHPSGDPAPSKADIEMTRLVRDALTAVGIQLHDHLVIGRKGHASFKGMGLL